MKIWAHRGCSQMYPENTILAFSKAMEIEGLSGIELDIQMTKDDEIVVIHDERVDRTTDGIGFVKDFTYSQIQGLSIETGKDQKEHIPSIIEVLELLQEKMKDGLLLNIELKNSNIPYEGMEEKIISLLNQFGDPIKKQIIYSSFYTRSLERIKDLEPKASVGILDMKVSDCLYKKRECFLQSAMEQLKDVWSENVDEKKFTQIALHPFWKGMDLTKDKLEGQTVRAWFGGHLYPEKSKETRIDLQKLECIGITDVFLNNPDIYLVS